MNKFVELARKHPPKYLDVFNSTFNDNSIDECTSEFKLECSCGGSIFSLIGEGDEDLGMSPIINSKCIICNNKHTIVHVNKYGYDAEYGHGTGYPEMELGSEEYSCECNGVSFNLSIWFTYQFEELDEFDGVELEKIPNYFDAVGISARCKCGVINHIGGFECA